MRTLSCTLTFQDGVKLTAKAAAKTEQETVRVDYSGDTLRIKPLPEKATLGFLEWYLQGVAANKGAEIEVKVDGDYDQPEK